MGNKQKNIYFYAKLFVMSTMLLTCVAMYDKRYSVFRLANVNPSYEKMFYLVVGAVTLWIALQRQTYLPFLGECVLPASVLNKESIPYTKNVVTKTIKVPGADKIVWWAADPKSSDTKELLDAEKAYGKYVNSGVTPVINGEATIVIDCPQEYKVKKGLYNKTLQKHVHYREVKGGMMSAVKTIFVTC